MGVYAKRTVLALLFFATLMQHIRCSSEDNVLTPDISYGGRVEIIAPARMKSGEYLPVVVQALTSDGSVDVEVTSSLRLVSAAMDLSGASIRLKKGMGSFSRRIDTQGNFRISVDDAIGEKVVQGFADIAAKSYEGTLVPAREVWDASFDRHIVDDLVVPVGSELLIEAGTRILLHGRVNIVVEGTLSVEGSKEQPVVFISRVWDEPWGGVEVRDADARFSYAFFVNGGADDARVFGHSASQPVLMARNAAVELQHCYFLDNPGKALGAHTSRVNIDQCLISRCDTGGEFHSSLVHISSSFVLDIPNDDGIFVDDDNDGFYFLLVYPGSDEPSRVEDTYIITGKDDAIDHNGAKLEINGCWLEGFMHEGVAGSNTNWVRVFNTVVRGCEQGIEAGYGEPTVEVDHCVVVDNGVGLRFGDSYDTGSRGKMVVTNTVLFNNGDNIYNHDLQVQAAVEGGITTRYSMTNDLDFDSSPFCITGVPRFDAGFRLLSGSPGAEMGSDGIDMGLFGAGVALSVDPL
jgi:hypothetical protein